MSFSLGDSCSSWMFKGDHRDKAARQRSLKEETQKAKAGFYAGVIRLPAFQVPSATALRAHLGQALLGGGWTSQ